MTIITFCPQPELNQCRELLHFLDTQHPDPPKEHFHALPELGARLRLPRSAPYVLVFLAPDHQTLEGLATLKNEIQGNDLLLLLPDSQDATLILGHSLRPRLLASMEEDIKVMAEVLGLVIRRAQTRREAWARSEEGG